MFASISTKSRITTIRATSTPRSTSTSVNALLIDVHSLAHSLATSLNLRASFSTISIMKRDDQGAVGENRTREVVTVLGLNNLSDNPGAVRRGRRVGRGIGSSKGKTCGKGHKGQKSRAGGGPSPRFEGGQTPFYRRLPKRGFTNPHAQPMVPINVGTLQDYIDMGRLTLPNVNDANDPPLTMKDLVDAGITKNSSIKHGIKLLAKGKERLRSPIKIEISRASNSAIQAIENVGGEITTVHYNRLALRALLKPQKFEVIPKRARPPPKLMQYYTDYDKRGYLSPEVQFKKVEQRLKEQLDDYDNDSVSSSQVASQSPQADDKLKD